MNNPIYTSFSNINISNIAEITYLLISLSLCHLKETHSETCASLNVNNAFQTTGSIIQ